MPYKLGIIKPSNRPGLRAAEELMAILPPGQIELLHDNLDIYHGTADELREAVAQYDPKVADMAKRGADLIHPAGAPPLLLGYSGEQELIARWESAYGVPVFTTGSSQVNAMRALGVKSIVCVSYIHGEVITRFRKYFGEAGFEVLDFAAMEVPFQDVPNIPPADIYEFVKAQFLANSSAEAIYMLGPAWRTMDLIEVWEKELGVPVIHHVPSQSWEIQRRFGLHSPVQGYGRLVAELPALPAGSSAMQ